jgi:hypothetical protein
MANLFAYPAVGRWRDSDVHPVHLELLARGCVVRQVVGKGEMVSGIDCTWIAFIIVGIAACVVPVVNSVMKPYRQKRLAKFQKSVNSEENT